MNGFEERARDDLRKPLDDQARRVSGSDDALEAVKRRTGRRRVARQVGTSVLALGVAAGGFALAVNAFSGRPGTIPRASPSGSVSPTLRAEVDHFEAIKIQQRFVESFVAARDAGSGAEAFLSPEARNDYSCCDLVLYPEDRIDFVRIGKFDKLDPDRSVVEVRLDFDPTGGLGVDAAVCFPLSERLTITRSAEGVDGFIVTAASSLDIYCVAGGGLLLEVGRGAPAAERDLIQGGTYWAVYLALDHRPSKMRAIADRLEEQGVPVSSGQIACDHGAAEELAVPNDVLAVAAYFDTNAEASAFFDAVKPSPVGIARVETYCED